MIQAQYKWHSRYSSRAVSSLLCDSHRRCLCACMYICALLYVPGMCTWSVLSQTQYITAAAQQQPHSGSRVSSPCFGASNHDICVCGWCTARDRTTTTFSRPMQRSNTHRRTSYHVHEAYSSGKSNSSFISMKQSLAMLPLLGLRRPGTSGYMTSTPSRTGALYYRTTQKMQQCKKKQQRVCIKLCIAEGTDINLGVDASRGKCGRPVGA